MSEYLKISQNKSKISEEIEHGDFKQNLSDHILYLKSFINVEDCEELIRSLSGEGLDKSTAYTDGLLNDDADSFFDPDIDVIKKIQDHIYNEGLKLYSEKVRPFNWSYFNTKKFYYSEMMIRRYHCNSEFSYHYDDFLEELFPQWFVRRKNVLSCTVYLNENYEGGDIQFAFGKSYQPSRGDVIIFPSNWMFYHRVNKITMGTKYSGTFWFYHGSPRRMVKQSVHNDIFGK